MSEASCLQCQHITSKTENYVLRQTLLPVRAKLNLPTRHKEKRPRRYPLIVEKKGQEAEISVPITNRPTVLILPRFKLPTQAESGKYRSSSLILNGVYIYPFRYPTFKEFGKQQGVDYVTETITYRGFKGGFSFARLLAKIAYGLAIAHFGVSIIDNSYVAASILGKSSDIGTWVGSTQERVTQTNSLHEIELNIQNNEVYAYIRLFTNLGSSGPTYLVVVARANQAQVTYVPITFRC